MANYGLVFRGEPWQRGGSPLKRPRHEPHPFSAAAGSSSSGTDPFLASLEQAEARDSQKKLQPAKPLAALETAVEEDDGGQQEKKGARRRRRRSNRTSPVVLVEAPLTRSASRSGITPLLDGLGMDNKPKSAWPIPTHYHSSESEAEEEDIVGAASAVPRRTRAVLPGVRAAKAKLATKASKEKKKKKTAEAAKSPIKKKSAGKKKAEKQQQNLLVPYKLPGSGEILFVRSSEIEKLHGIDGGHGTRSELKMLLGRALRQ